MPFRIHVATLAATFLTCPAMAESPTTPQQQTIERQIRAFQSGRDDDAYSQAAPNIRRFFPTLDSFMSMVRGGYRPVYNPEYWDYGTSEALSDGMVRQEVLVTDETGRDWTATYTLERQADGSWKIAAVTLRQRTDLLM